MSWVRLDDGFDENPKQMRMSSGAVRLYVCSLTFCARQRQLSGYMTSEQAQGLCRKLPGVGSKAVHELVSLNAWEVADGGYLIHDYVDYVDHGSRDRVRKHRELKRQGNVTEDVTDTLLARDGYPIPKPVPVKGFSPIATSGSQSPREEAADGLTTEGPDVVAYGECFVKHGRVPSAVDLEVLRRIPYEFDRLSHAVILEAIEEVATKFGARDKPMPPAKYLLGKLADMQVRASEAGARPQAQLNSGLTRLGDLLPGVAT